MTKKWANWAEIVPALQTIRYSQDTADVTITKQHGPDRGMIVYLPFYYGEYETPLTWGDRYARVVDDTHLEVTWQAMHRNGPPTSGVAVIDDDHRTVTIDGLGTVTVEIEHFYSSRMLHQRLRAIEARANEARWKSLIGLESYMSYQVAAASYAVAEESGLNVTDSDGFDHVGLFAAADYTPIVNELLFGVEGSADSPVIRALNRCATLMDRGIDPRPAFVRSIRSAAYSAARRRVGDPKVGPLIRRIAAKEGTTDVKQIVDRLRRTCPGEAIGAKRVRAALTVAASPHIETLPLSAVRETIRHDGNRMVRVLRHNTAA